MDAQDREDLEDYLCNFIKVGTVCATDPVAHTVKVVYPEDDNTESHELRVLVPNTYDNADYAMPDLNEDVVCLFLPCGSVEGFVLGSFFTGEVKPPSDSQDIRMVRFKDGTTITYDRAAHTYDIEIENTHIHADRDKVNIETPQQVNVVTTDLSVTASGSVVINGANGIALKSGGPVTINGSAVSFN